MRKLTLSLAFYTLEGEYLDTYEQVDMESFGDSEATIAEAKTYEEMTEISIELKDLDAYWQKCQENPLHIQTLQIGEGTYETNNQSETYKGIVKAFLNSWCQTDPKPAIPEPQEVQLELF